MRTQELRYGGAPGGSRGDMEKAIRDLIDEFASRAPSPAAGAAAALSLTHGAALGLKAVRLALTPHADAHVRDLLTAAEDELLEVVAQGIPKFDEIVWLCELSSFGSAHRANVEARLRRVKQTMLSMMRCGFPLRSFPLPGTESSPWRRLSASSRRR